VELNPPGEFSDEGGRHAARAILEDGTRPRGAQAALVGSEVSWIESAGGGNQKVGSSLRRRSGQANLSWRTIFSQTETRKSRAPTRAYGEQGTRLWWGR